MRTPKRVYGVISSDVYGVLFFCKRDEASAEVFAQRAAGVDDSRVVTYQRVGPLVRARKAKPVRPNK